MSNKKIYFVKKWAGTEIKFSCWRKNKNNSDNYTINLSINYVWESLWVLIIMNVQLNIR